MSAKLNRVAANSLDYQPPWRPHIFHALSLEFFGLVQFQSQIEQTQRRDHSQGEAYPPRRSQVAVSCGENDYHWHESRGHKPKVNLHIGEHDEPT